MFEALNQAAIATFGRDAVYHRRSNSQEYPIRVIFDRRYLGEPMAMGPETSAMVTLAFVRLADLSFPPAAKDRLTVNGMEYTIADVEPDAEGGALLMLKVRA